MKDQHLTVYSTESVLRHPRRFVRRAVDDLQRSHSLGWRLAVRDLNALYRQTALGFLWALLLPLGNAAAWLMMRNAGIVQTGDTQVPYALYVFIGTMAWGIFIDALMAPVQQAVAAKPLLARVSFPPEALVVSGVYQTLVAASIKLALIVLACLLAGHSSGWAMLLLPLAALVLILLGTAIGALVTPVGLLYTDVAKSLPLLAQFLMYLSPVVYAAPGQGWVADAMRFNPVTPLLVGTRAWATGLGTAPVGDICIVASAAILLLLAVWGAYKAAMPILVERMGT